MHTSGERGAEIPMTNIGADSSVLSATTHRFPLKRLKANADIILFYFKCSHISQHAMELESYGM